MADSPIRSPRTFSDMDSALAVLREGGGRASTSRRAILEVMFGADGPRSTEQISTAASPPLDLASTYRSLEHLEKVGLVRHVHLGHGPALYELAGRGVREYALCESCGASSSFDPAELDAARADLERITGYRPRFSHFPLVGLCAECLAAEREPT